MRVLGQQEAKLALQGASDGTLSSVRFPERFTWEARSYRRAVFEECDFAAPLIHGGVWSKQEFHDCRFVRCDFDGLSVRKVLFRNCSFEEVEFGKKSRGSIEQCRFEGCRFEEARLGQLSITATSWLDCQLKAVRSSRTKWERCDLDRTSMSGRFETVNFIACRFRESDFSGVTFRDVSFVENREFDLRLPDNPSNFLARPVAFAEAGRSLDGKIASKSLETFSELAVILSKSSSPVMVDEELLEDLSAADRRTVLEELYRLR